MTVPMTAMVGSTSARVTPRSGSPGHETVATVHDAPGAAPFGQFMGDAALVTVSVPSGSEAPLSWPEAPSPPPPPSGVLVSVASAASDPLSGCAPASEVSAGLEFPQPIRATTTTLHQVFMAGACATQVPRTERSFSAVFWCFRRTADRLDPPGTEGRHSQIRLHHPV
jgi:hypothetical protein